MDHHQGDGNSLLHRVASVLLPATLKCSLSTIAPLLRDGEGLFHSLELDLTAKRDTRWKRQLQWEDLPVRPGISINNHADYGGKDASCSSHSKVLFWHNRPSFEGRRGLIPQSRVGLNCQTRFEVETPVAMGGSTSTAWDLN
jgi:hypothetical protein